MHRSAAVGSPMPQMSAGAIWKRRGPTRVRLPCPLVPGGFVFAARDWFVGGGLFLLIIALAVAYYGFATPYAHTITEAELSNTEWLGSLARWIASVRNVSWGFCLVTVTIAELELLGILFGDPGIATDVPVDAEVAPDGVHRCPVCGVFVEDFDHHCGIIGACIGRRTMPLFVTFLGTTAILLFAAFLHVGPQLVFAYLRGDIGLAIPSLQVIGTFVMCVGAMYLGSYTAMLFSWYLYLGFRGQFSLSRRRALLAAASADESCTTPLPKRKVDHTRPCSPGEAADMFRQLRHWRLAKQ